MAALKHHGMKMHRTGQSVHTIDDVWHRILTDYGSPGERNDHV